MTLSKSEKGILSRNLSKMTGYSRQQFTRLISNIGMLEIDGSVTMKKVNSATTITKLII